MLPNIPRRLRRYIDKRDFRVTTLTHRVTVTHLYNSGQNVTYTFGINSQGLDLDQISSIVFTYVEKCVPVMLQTVIKDTTTTKKTHRVLVREIQEDRNNGASKTKSYTFASHSSYEIAVMLEKLCCNGYSKLEERRS